MNSKDACSWHPFEHLFPRSSLPRAALALFLSSMAGGCQKESISVTSLSPDRSFRVEMVEQTGRMDRNFSLRLHRAADQTATTLFESPDEGSPPGTERIVWSRDGTQFVVLGRHFFVPDTVKLSNGEALYLHYDLKSGSLRCNSIAQTRFPGFTRDELKRVDWSTAF